jgi:hypothetical protein
MCHIGTKMRLSPESTDGQENDREQPQETFYRPAEIVATISFVGISAALPFR